MAINSPLDFLSTNGNHGIRKNEMMYVIIVIPMTTTISCLFFHKMNDFFGRKPTLMFLAIAYLIFWLLITNEKSEVIYLAAIFCGIGNGLYYVSLPIYIGEISNPTVRGTWGNLVIIMLHLGSFLMRLMKTYLKFDQVRYLCLTLTLIYLVLLIFIPESPYYFIKMDREEDARKSLGLLSRKENINEKFARFKVDVASQISEGGSWIDLFRIRSNRNALLIGIFLRFSQFTSGNFIMTFLESYIFLFIIYDNTTVMLPQFLIYGIQIILTAFSAVILLEGLGRKINYMFSLIACSLILISMGLFFFVENNLQVDLFNFQWVPLALTILYIIFMSLGVGNIPSIMLSEIFSLSIKTKALTVVAIVACVTQLFSIYMFYILNLKYYLFTPFLFFGIIGFLSGVLSGKILPETKGKSLEEIQQLLKRS